MLPCGIPETADNKSDRVTVVNRDYLAIARCIANMPWPAD